MGLRRPSSGLAVDSGISIFRESENVGLRFVTEAKRPISDLRNAGITKSHSAPIVISSRFVDLSYHVVHPRSLRRSAQRH